MVQGRRAPLPHSQVHRERLTGDKLAVGPGRRLDFLRAGDGKYDPVGDLQIHVTAHSLDAIDELPGQALGFQLIVQLRIEGYGDRYRTACGRDVRDALIDNFGSDA